MTAPVLMQFQDLPFNGDTFVNEEFIRLRDKFGINKAIETGSCLYSTTEWLGQNFDQVYTVEINPEFASFGVHKVQDMENVHTHIMDSLSFLRYLLPVLRPTDKCLFFLDAHWGQHCPLLDELHEIANIKTGQPPIIVIHDFYTGDEALGYDEYNGQRFDYLWIEPSVKVLEQKLNCTYEHHFNTQAIGAKRGLIYLTPKL